MKIGIDAGHGYYTAGKRTPDGIREWSLNDKVADYLASYLKGYATTFRTDDTRGKKDISLRTRRNNAIKKGAKLLISIHHNALKGKWCKATGTEVYRHTLYAHKQAKELASKLAVAISKSTGLPNRGSKKALFTVIATSKIPCVLCEGGFMDGKSDSKYIRTEAGQKAYAKAVADTIISYYGLKKTTSTTTSTTTKTIGKTVSYKVKITANSLNVRDGAGMDEKVNTTVKKGQMYTIVEEKNGWGKLKSGAGWIKLDYTTKITSTSKKTTTKYYAKCTSNHTSIVSALKSIGVNSSFSNRKKIAKKNSIKLYIGTASQNNKLLKLLKQGKLIKI